MKRCLHPDGMALRKLMRWAMAFMVRRSLKLRHHAETRETRND